VTGLVLGDGPKPLRVDLTPDSTFDYGIRLQTAAGEALILDDGATLVLELGDTEVTADQVGENLHFSMTVEEVNAVLAETDRTAVLRYITTDPPRRMAWFEGVIK